MPLWVIFVSVIVCCWFRPDWRWMGILLPLSPSVVPHSDFAWRKCFSLCVCVCVARWAKWMRARTLQDGVCVSKSFRKTARGEQFVSGCEDRTLLQPPPGAEPEWRPLMRLTFWGDPEERVVNLRVNEPNLNYTWQTEAAAHRPATDHWPSAWSPWRQRPRVKVTPSDLWLNVFNRRVRRGKNQSEAAIFVSS